MKEAVFQDYYHNQVRFSTQYHPYSAAPKHVWVICRYRGHWLLTKHPSRGVEFPGGKVEEGENVEHAAIREVSEETGGVVGNLHYIGQYRVAGKAETVIKDVYFAEIEELKVKDSYFETKGPKLLLHLPASLRFDKTYSFIMKDDVLSLSMKEIERRFLNASRN